ncbi:phosphotransferase [Kitasatospora sp. NPDC058243]|uniref:phosphotransferase n=1 Tax=Kitasatospora sp. NPDC058243 TaxID=3346397 RepID=UPI0036DC55FA
MTDLRRAPVDEVLVRVETALGTQLDRATVVRKRRSVGAGTARGTWVRIERRGLDRIGVQGWDGTPSAEALRGIAKPAWLAGIAWRDEVEPVMWRADEAELLPSAPAGSAVVTEDPDLPPSWWPELNASLDALARQRTNRIATPDTETITQELVTRTIRQVFPGIDATVSEWCPAHADLNWANVTAPEFCVFDWEDWGMAPRGLDAATLWAASLAVPALADRVRVERSGDFASRDGKLMTLFVAAKILGPYAHPEDPRPQGARVLAEQVVKELQAD